MKRYISIIAALLFTVSIVQAQDKRLSKEEFQQKQKEFISRCAGLSESEADQFFPLYFELQKKKEEINGKMWDNMHKGKERELTEQEYSDILETVAKLRISSDQLELDYLHKFEKFLSCKKIYNIQRAEMRFHHELLREARDRRDPKNPPLR